MNRYNWICLLAILQCAAFQALANPTSGPDKQEFVRVFKKEFLGMTANTEQQLANQHGKIVVHTWAQNKSMVTVRVTVRASAQDDADVMFNRIKIKFSNTNVFARAETQIESGKSWWNWFGDNPDFTIDYEIFMPAVSKLNLSNEYGNSSVDPMQNNIVANVDYGNLHIQGTSGALSVNLDYGNLIVNKSVNANINLDYGNLTYGSSSGTLNVNSDYSKLTFESSNKLNINTDYSDVSVERVTHINCNAAYGSYRLGKVDYAVIEGDYTDFSLESLSKDIDINSDYGDVRIDNIEPGFTNIKVVADYATAHLGFKPGASYKVKANVSYGDIHNGCCSSTSRVSSSGSDKSFSSTVGSGSGNVSVNLNYGSLYLE